MGYVDGAARQNVVVREYVRTVDFTFCSNRTVWDRAFANFNALGVPHPNFSRAFGARADVLGYVNGGSAPQSSPS